MAYSIINPPKSFVQFGTPPPVESPCFPETEGALPVYEEADVAFQLAIQADTVEEANAICGAGAVNIEFGLVDECGQPDFSVQFPETPSVKRISDTKVNVDWPHGLTGMLGNYPEGSCFRIMMRIGGETWCSNYFRRITLKEACETSVIEYGNNENAFGFVYCGNSEGVEDAEGVTCDPEIVTFLNQTTLVIPYTALFQTKFGQVPTVQVWIYDENGFPTNMGIQAQFDQLPPTQILIDLGGTASGFVVIR